jgi:hypothetical protein
MSNGVYVCPICGGVGWHLNNDHYYASLCSLCNGKGEIDWVTKIMKPKKTKEHENILSLHDFIKKQYKGFNKTKNEGETNDKN